MIKIKRIDKENNNIYFVIYELNKNIHTASGNPKEIIDELCKIIEKINEQ